MKFTANILKAAIILCLTMPLFSGAQVRWDPPIIGAPDDGSRLMMLRRAAQSAEARRDYEGALKYYRQIQAMGARWDYYYHGELRCLLALKLYEEAAALVQGEIVKLDRGLAHGKRKIELLVDLGEVYLSSGDEEYAWLYWDQALASRAADHIIYRSVSGALMRAGRLEQAVETLKRGEDRLGERVLAQDLAVAYIAMMDYKNAVHYLLIRLKHTPAQYKYIERMIYNLPGGDTATEPVIAALKEAKDNPQARRLLAGYLFSLGRYEEALKRTVEVDKKGAELLNFAASVKNEGRYDIALEAYSAALKKLDSRASQRPQALLGMAECLDHLSRYGEALELYRQILREYPRSAGYNDETAYRIGEIYLERLNLPDSAEVYYRKLKTGRYRAEAGLALGKCALMKGEVTEALRRYRAFNTSVAGGNIDIIIRSRLMEGRCLFWLGEADSAVAVWNELARARPLSEAANDALRDAMTFGGVKDSVITAQFAAAWLKSAIRDYRGAAEGFSAVMERTPGSVIGGRAALEMGEALRRLSKPDSAAAALERYLEEYPEAASRDEILFLLGAVALEDWGDLARARAYYERLLVETPDSPLAPVVRRKLDSIM